MKCVVGVVLLVEGWVVVLLLKSLLIFLEVFVCLIFCWSVIISDIWNILLISIDMFLNIVVWYCIVFLRDSLMVVKKVNSI